MKRILMLLALLSFVVVFSTCGQDGLNGTSGKNGQDGSSGQDGSDGQDGSICSVEEIDNCAIITCNDGTSATICAPSCKKDKKVK